MTSRSLKFVVVLGLMATLFIGGKPSGTEAASNSLIIPTSGTVTSEYGTRWGTFHHGIDYGNVRGTQVVASADGIVTRASGGCYEGNASCNGSFGNVIYIKHVLSSGEIYTTVYAHLNSINVSVDQTVSQGQVIGNLGNTGDSTGPHLHFEVHQGNFSRSPSHSINPRNVLNGEYVQASYQNPYSGIGEATSKYPDGYGINIYNVPNGTYVGVITKKIPYIVNLEYDGWLNIGNNQWVKEENMNYKRYTASSKYSSGLGVNVYSGPNGEYVGRIYGPTAYRVYYYSDGWVDLGNSHWVKAEHLIIK
ncbi:M23 family metallopeptidase [Bacillus sp. AGMB 02131]|uniref:M23 family metallopeptidase n=1 Tax=Peribacillus faecalis TaxID=2772559 RepID=A0A927CUE0_9BACI|nr:M23 family metallopeptidase [Peribacillus faecalis]MBD3107374.1 M23 family metallopeptidase [Peribacillus faecalis]